MRAHVVLAVALLSLVSFACAEKPKSEAVAPVAMTPQLTPNGKPVQSGAKVTATAQNQTAAQPTFPKGARYTIYCTAFSGAMHVQEATDAKNKIFDTTKDKNWYVVHEQDQSTLYYGYYQTFEHRDNEKEADRAHKDLDRIREMTNTQFERPFAHAQPVPLIAPDPTAPPEWNLTNAKGYWTIQIGAYKDSPDRKQYAVDAVRELRKAGVEAYYYHGETTSSVCVGAWPQEALQKQDTSVAGEDNPNESVMVSTVPLPANLTRNMRDENGQPIKYYEARVVIVDPTMKDAKMKFPRNAVNGYDIPHKAKDVKGNDTIVYDPSVIVMIPQPEENALSHGSIAAQQQTAPRVPMYQQQGVGSKLRALGE